MTPSSFLLRDVTVVDGTGADPVPGQALVVEGRRIVWRGPVDQARCRHGLVCPHGGQFEVAGHDPGDQEQVGVAGRSNEVDPQALDVVVWIDQRGDLPLAAVARTDVEVTHVERATEGLKNRSAEPPRRAELVLANDR